MLLSKHTVKDAEKVAGLFDKLSGHPHQPQVPGVHSISQLAQQVR